MGHDKFTFERIELLESRIRRLSRDAAYIQVWDRTDRKNEQNLGRFDLTESDALPYLEEPIQPALPPPPEEDDEPDPFEDEFGEYDDFEEEDEDDEPVRQASKPVTPEVIAEAACRWVRELAISNTVGDEWCRYRAKVYGPKGMKVLHTGTFIVRNGDHDIEAPPPSEIRDLKIPTPTFEEAESAGAAKGVKALGDYYAQWGRIVLGSVGQLQGVNNEMVARLHKALGESREQVDQLVAAVLENRFNELQLNEERHASERQDDARNALAKEALSQLGDAAKTFLTARGINPELADVLGVLGSSPELLGALNDPDVRSLMQDPSNLSSLAQMLKLAGQQARAARDGAGAPAGDPITTDNQQSSPAAG